MVILCTDSNKTKNELPVLWTFPLPSPSAMYEQCILWVITSLMEMLLLTISYYLLINKIKQNREREEIISKECHDKSLFLTKNIFFTQ